jgi:hypothetical protein
MVSGIQKVFTATTTSVVYIKHGYHVKNRPCGKTIKQVKNCLLIIVDSTTGECRTAQVFVAVMGASNYTFAEATFSQKLEDWVMSHARCFEFLGGVPELVIPDNLKSAVTTLSLHLSETGQSAY